MTTTGALAHLRPAATDGQPGGLFVGVDVGGSKIAVLVVDAALDVLSRRTIPTSVGEPDEAAGQIASAIDAALAGAGASIRDVRAVGVGVPGRVDPATGVVSLAVNLGWHRLPLRERLEAILGVPVTIENDVRAAAAGILDRGTLGDVRDFIYLSVGTGISAGVVIDGAVHRGTRGLAGEIGHIVVDADGPGAALVRPARLPRDDRVRLAIARAAGDDRTAADVYAAAAAGDPTATAVVDRAGAALARAIHALVMTYDVERIVLGGGVSRGGAAFIDPVFRELDAMRAASELATDMLPADVVAVSPTAATSARGAGSASPER